jgi:hypothetical protein
MVYEDVAYFLMWQSVQMNLFENVLSYLQWSSLMKIHIGMEQVWSLIS